MLDWALTAAAVLTFLFAVRILFLSTKEREEGREKLGCGFSLVAALLWIYVLDGHIGELVPAIRIALGLLLVLPAVQALADPARARILRAIGGLILGILVAGPVVSQLWGRYGPDTRSEAVRDAEDRLAEARALEERLSERRSALTRLRNELRTEVRAFGRDWETIETNEEALEKLGLLGEVAGELAEVEGGLAKLRTMVAELEADAASARDADAIQVSGADREVELLRRQLEEAPSLDDLGIVEKHAKKKELRSLFEAEF